MDVIIDSNIIRASNYLRSQKFAAVFDYLHKTRSKLVIPEIVQQEVVASYRRDLRESYEKLQRQASQLKSMCFSGNAKVETDLDVEKEVSAYEAHIQSLIAGQKVQLLPYQDTFMREVVRRLTERIRPASPKGEESRDVIIWLSIKEFLKDTPKKEASFISTDSSAFAAERSTKLHPDLVAELSADGLQLRYFSSTDDFIREHRTRVEYVTQEWVDAALAAAGLRQLVEQRIWMHYNEWRLWSEKPVWSKKPGVEKLTEELGYEDVAIKYLHIEDYFVYKIDDKEQYLHASYTGEIEVYPTFRMPLEFPMASTYTSVLTFTTEVKVEVGCMIRDQEVQDLSIEDLSVLELV